MGQNITRCAGERKMLENCLMVRTKRSAAGVAKGEAAEREKAIRIHSNSLACEVISIKRQRGRERERRKKAAKK